MTSGVRRELYGLDFGLAEGGGYRFFDFLN